MMTLAQGRRIYIVYLRAKRVRGKRLAMYLRVLDHIQEFYGPQYPLYRMTGQRILEYADRYDPWHENPEFQERAKVFWKFAHWLKKNRMIPGFTET